MIRLVLTERDFIGGGVTDDRESTLINATAAKGCWVGEVAAMRGR